MSSRRFGLTYRDIEKLAGLIQDLSAQKGWLDWSILQTLREEKLIDAAKRGHFYWTLSNDIR
jgi:hypothetical protein